MKNETSLPSFHNEILAHKSHFAELQSRLRHLDSVVGMHMRALESGLGKISGRKPLHQAVPLTASAPFSGQALMGDFTSIGRSALRSSVNTFLGNTSSRSSQGQDISDL